MKARQKNETEGEQEPSACGGSLSASYAPLNLENRFLAQSIVIPQTHSLLLNHAAQPSSSPSLKPSSLSSTSSSLLCTSLCSSSLTSPLLSTENMLLSSHSILTTPSCLTSMANGYIVSTSLSNTSLLNQFAPAEDREESSEVKPLCLEETGLVNKTFFIVICYYYFV